MRFPTTSPDAEPLLAEVPLEIRATMAAIDSMRGTLSIARALVLSGREVDLRGLDAEAQRLCAAVACLPGPGAAVLLDPLMGLTREVDLLAICIPPP